MTHYFVPLFLVYDESRYSILGSISKYIAGAIIICCKKYGNMGIGKLGWIFFFEESKILPTRPQAATQIVDLFKKDREYIIARNERTGSMIRIYELF